MKKLFKLKEWLTVPEAAAHLSILLDDDVTEADVLRLALDRHLKLSVYFVNYARAKCGKKVSSKEAKVGELIGFDGQPVRYYKGVQLDSNEVLELEDTITKLTGIWDLPMLGAEALDVEHEYQHLTGGPDVTLHCLEGAFVEGKNGVFAQIQEHFSENEYAKPEHLKEPWSNPLNFYPSATLPHDSVYVVRTKALRDFEQYVREQSGEIAADELSSGAIGSRERPKFLAVIKALAMECGIPVDKTSKAEEIVQRVAEKHDVKVPTGKGPIAAIFKEIRDELKD